jgi:excisionase family DNA binding protein
MRQPEPRRTHGLQAPALEEVDPDGSDWATGDRSPRTRRSSTAQTPSPASSSTPPLAGSSPALDNGRPRPGFSDSRLAYSVDEAARLTGLSRDLLYDQMRRGKLCYVKIGRRRVITRQHLEQFLGVAS